MTAHDSAWETNEHRRTVRSLIHECRYALMDRALNHDESKLKPPEKDGFDAMTPLLLSSTYGSPEYKEFLEALKPVLAHHYAANAHHPEHHVNGIAGMTLIDLVEMLCDWKAAGQRHANGSIEKSLAVNRERFAIGDQLQAILVNTVRAMAWETKQK
jgi:hypothetical protein